MEDVRWLGFDWEDRLFYASDYFEKLHEFAIQLIKEGKAYVDDQMLKPLAAKKVHQPGRELKVRSETVQWKKILICFSE